MNTRFKKLVTVFFVALLTLSSSLITLRPALAQTTAVSVVPSLLEFGPAACVGTEFVITVEVTDVADLYGIDVKFAWDTEYLLYLNHTAHIPVETYSDGILHEPGMYIKNIANATEGTYWVAYASQAPAEGFDGSGIVFDMAFRIKKQPMEPDPDAILTMDITSSSLPNSAGDPITHTRNDGTVKIYAKPFEYPPEILLKIDPAEVSDLPIGSTFESSVYLMGDGETYLDPFWDPAGFDIYVNFKRTDPPYLILEALEVDIDPDGWFAGFWPGGIYEVTKTINNAEGSVHVVFLGLPAGDGSHTAPYGQGRLFNITFNPIYESDTYPPPTVTITLKNPKGIVRTANLDADAGLINLSSPVGTGWTGIATDDFGTSYSLDSWVDKYMDGKLGPGDELILTSGGKWHPYEVKDLKGTLELTQQPFEATDDKLWAVNFPDTGLSNNKLKGRTLGDSSGYDGYGYPYWTGNFTLYYPFTSVATITVHALPFTGDEYTYTLTEGVDYIVYADENKIELLTPLDVDIVNEYWVDGVNNTLNGWPWINYVASGIQSVYVRFPNATERYAINNGFEEAPPAEWWYEPDWPWELEGWWALGYMKAYNASDPKTWYVWPPGTEWWINYTAASYLTVDYFAEPDPRPYYFEFSGSYAAFLALGDPVDTVWKEIYPNTLHSWNCTDWTDTDTSGDITVGDYITLIDHVVGVREYLVDRLATDIIVDQIRTLCDDGDTTDEYYGREPIVKVAGFPHPDYSYCPWHGSDQSVGLPHKVTSATFEAYFKPPGAWIDVYTQYPAPFGGQGPNQPSDMFWPQKEVILYAFVTYNFWPEQNKDVAFEVKDNHMTVWGIFYARTGEDGIAWVKVRLPWPCDDPDYYRGEWHVYATVDVACKAINDTLNFKYDYLVNIWKVTTDKTTYAHSEDMVITIDYGSYAMRYFNVTITVTVVDETGVPFGYTYIGVTVGGAQYCSYNNGTVILTVHVVKFARAGLAKIYVGALSDFPQNGGYAVAQGYTPPPEIGILAEWA